MGIASNPPPKTVDESAEEKRRLLHEKINHLSNYQILKGGWWEFEFEHTKYWFYVGEGSPQGPPPGPD